LFSFIFIVHSRRLKFPEVADTALVHIGPCAVQPQPVKPALHLDADITVRQTFSLCAGNYPNFYLEYFASAQRRGKTGLAEHEK
jgi:hypothetical protein